MIQIRWWNGELQYRIRDVECDASGAVSGFGSWGAWVGVPSVSVHDGNVIVDMRTGGADELQSARESKRGESHE
jgi:hypothetical protein